MALPTLSVWDDTHAGAERHEQAERLLDALPSEEGRQQEEGGEEEVSLVCARFTNLL